jgi:hypothetical protein
MPAGKSGRVAVWKVRRYGTSATNGCRTRQNSSGSSAAAAWPKAGDLAGA